MRRLLLDRLREKLVHPHPRPHPHPQPRPRPHPQDRFRKEIVYTYVGDIVVSVNPFKNVGCVGTWLSGPVVG